jgi:DNA-binding transcriptional LysR family regulator
VDRSTYPVQLTTAGRQFLATAKLTLAQLSDARQSIRATEQGNLPLLRFAALHAISVNYLQSRLADLERTIPELRTRVTSDTMAACCQLLTEGGCDFLLYYRHQHFEPILDETRFVRKDICTEELVPVAHHAAAARHGWSLGGRSRIPVPYLAYDSDTFLGTVVDRTIGERQTSLEIRYVDALAEALKRRTLAGSGVAWLPAFSIANELADGTLVRLGGRTWAAKLTISLLCSPDRLDPVGQQIWEAF